MSIELDPKLAAAHELYEALWGIIGQIEQAEEGFGIMVESSSLKEAVADAYAALAKARGEA